MFCSKGKEVFSLSLYEDVCSSHSPQAEKRRTSNLAPLSHAPPQPCTFHSFECLQSSQICCRSLSCFPPWLAFHGTFHFKSKPRLLSLFCCFTSLLSSLDLFQLVFVEPHGHNVQHPKKSLHGSNPNFQTNMIHICSLEVKLGHLLVT